MKLVKCARLLKADFVEKYIRRAPYTEHNPTDSDCNISLEYGTSIADKLAELSRQTHVALNHLYDVIAKRKLEMLPGNGTVVLDMVWLINLAVNSYISATKATSNCDDLTSAVSRMRHSMAHLLRLCDDAVLIDAAGTDLSCEHFHVVIKQLEGAIEQLVHKICTHSLQQVCDRRQQVLLYHEAKQEQCTSLPEIPQVSKQEPYVSKATIKTLPMLKTSYSSDSILFDSFPPPKPPLPYDMVAHNSYSHLTDTITSPPPLPPKKKQSGVFTSQERDFQYSSAENVLLEMDDISNNKQPSDSKSSPQSSKSLHSFRRDLIESQSIKDAIISSSSSVDNVHSSSDETDSSYSWDEFSSSSVLAANDDSASSLVEYCHLPNTESNAIKGGRVESDSTLYTQKAAAKSTTGRQHAFSPSDFDVATRGSGAPTVIIGPQTDGLKPPSLPPKTKRSPTKPDQCTASQNLLEDEILVTCGSHKLTSLQDETGSSAEMRPPPIPPKRKHAFQSVAYSVMAYMEMFGNCSHVNDPDFLRRSTCEVPIREAIIGHSPCHRKTISSFTYCNPSIYSDASSDAVFVRNPLETLGEANNLIPPSLPPKQSLFQAPSSIRYTLHVNPESALREDRSGKALPDVVNDTEKRSISVSHAAIETDSRIFMRESDAMTWLVTKPSDEEGPNIRGGTIDALIVYATKSSRPDGVMYQDAFLTTYRTFMTPLDLVDKLVARYNHFYLPPEDKCQCRETFALLVRAVTEFTAHDVTECLHKCIMAFEQQLVLWGELTLAKVLRVKYLERYEMKQLNSKEGTNPSGAVRLSCSPGDGRHDTILDFKARTIAEQMTLLDCQLFVRIEIPEILWWAHEQNEERSPNLTHFTEHFNKVSYWARTLILTAEGRPVRRKLVYKFLKIMQHLRRMNNFNSYLALLSALDSAPVQRLGWKKHISESLTQYCTLIDSSSSFRAYRQALAETQPPCIPYIGLILQDLTFIHIGNSDDFPDGKINFSKRWQQYNIVNIIKQFKKTVYMFTKNERILHMFNNFDDFISEDAMWQLSEAIKPRGNKPNNCT